MASSINSKGKNVVDVNWEMEEQILCPTPISWFNPNADSQGTKQVSLKPTSHEKIRDEIGYFTLPEKAVKDVQEWDEVFKTSPEFEKYKKVWVPVSVRLAQWRIEIRKRKNGGRIEMFYHHPNLSRQLRSKKQVYEYLYYGFVADNQEGSSASDVLNSFPQRLMKRQRTQEEEVEEFLAKARRNLMNVKSDE